MEISDGGWKRGNGPTTKTSIAQKSNRCEIISTTNDVVSARRFLEALETRAAELGHNTLMLDTTVQQTAAQGLYIKSV